MEFMGRGVINRVVRFPFVPLFAVCVVLSVGGFQSANAQEAATVSNIAVTGSDHDLAVQITATKPITPRTEFVTSPDRLIVDLPEARPETGLRKILIQRGNLKGVRIGLLSANPPITRVVLDLVAPPQFRVLPLANAVVVKLAEASEVQSASITPIGNAPATVLPAASTPAVAIAQLDAPSGRSWFHWIMPVLVTTTILAMLIIALVINIQNRKYRRGL